MTVPEVPKWVMPWIPPTGAATQAALRALDRPLVAWPNGEFDSEEYYAGFPASEMSALEREVRKLGTRPTWRMERIWFPDSEASPEETATYEAACRDVAGRMIMPRCLDAFVMEAYAAAGLGEGEDPGGADIDDEDFGEALAWAEAGVCVLQQSLPWPFTCCLPYGGTRQPARPSRPVRVCEPAESTAPAQGRAVVSRDGLSEPALQHRCPLHRPRRSAKLTTGQVTSRSPLLGRGRRAARGCCHPTGSWRTPRQP